MLYLRKRAERLSRESDSEFERMVAATRIGVLTAFDKKAAASWRARMAASSTTPPQTVDGYKATIARLGSLTTRGKPLGLVN